MMTRPSLQEIADAPLTVGLKMVRESYDPNWGKGTDGQTYYVSLSWEVVQYDDETFCVSADSPEEAIDKAREYVEYSAPAGELEWTHSKVLADKPKHFVEIDEKVAQ